MNIDIEQLQQAIAIMNCLDGNSPSKQRDDIDHGFAFVIADRGFVWIGDVVETENEHIISDGAIVRYWGTDKGLNQLCTGGPREKTKIDMEAKTVKVKNHAVIAVVPCQDRELWKK